MQIIIIQTEIEEAIRNHILSQINIKEDQRIDIDLRATRGSDGFQAVIDIVAGDTPVRAQEAQAQVEPEAQVATPTKPVTAAKKTTAAKAAAPKVIQATEADDILPDPVEQEPDMSAEADTGEQPIAEEDVVESDIQADEEAPPATKKTSLFANMKKPENA